MGSYRPLSWWHDEAGAGSWAPRPTLDGDLDVDVAIVGAGFTGLWTAYYLADLNPTLRIVVVEAEYAGFGASGRNGGWCSALLPMSLHAVADRHGVDAARRLQAAMNDTVDEVRAVTRREGINCGFAKGGWIAAARSRPQVTRLRAAVEEIQAFGEPDDAEWLDATDAADRLGVTGLNGALAARHCAVLQPAMLVRGLAEAVERRGVTIHEHSPASALRPGTVCTPLGTIRARVVVRATEAFTVGLPRMRRTLVPIYSLMIATEPLPAEFWQRAGLARREAFTDGRRMVIYGQRTAGDRLAFGGRGVPYHFASALSPRFEQDQCTHARLEATLRALFPYLGRAAITHRWGGAVAAPRDWHCSVSFDPATGMGAAGGYVGDGVSTANLAGRTLAQLIAGRTGELTDLAWVGHLSPRWEPEPLRWLGINAAARLAEHVDRREARTGRTPRWADRVLDRLMP